MSGICGIWNLESERVDAVLLRRMTESMAFRGPDAQNMWIGQPDGAIGFGHTLLKTTYESEHEQQPMTLDGRLWIVADARVDAQDELISKLNARGEQVTRGVTDVELLLRAYRVWREECVEHLLGDFAFAVWDAERRKLFCARDQFGIKLFYYARIGQSFIFSNTLDCIREHRAVSDRLNELAIADFLLFEMNQDPATTTFADIQSLPAAHTLTCDHSTVRTKRYWSLPVDEPVRFKRAQDYPDRFLELLRTAVRDRVRTDKVAIYMSGGLDSTSAAAVMRPLCDVRAYTAVYDHLIPDEERYYSRLAAKALDIPVQYLAADNYRLFERWDEPEFYRPEPDHAPLRAVEVDQMRQIHDHARVVFYCEGPDNAMRYEWRPYVRDLVRRRRFGRLAMDFSQYVALHRRLPLIKGIRNRLKGTSGHSAEGPAFPAWIRPEASQRLGLEQRWRDTLNDPISSHPLRPKGAASFAISNWRYMFEQGDAGVNGFAAETRHPFLDVRMIRYLLSLPAIPWCTDKLVMREAMKNVLPEPVRLRPKTPLQGDPIGELARRGRGASLPSQLSPGVTEYVDPARLAGAELLPGSDAWSASRPCSLHFWLAASFTRRHAQTAVA